MGMIESPDKCHITGSSTENKPSSIHAVEYYTEYAGIKYFFVFDCNHKNSDFVEKNKYVLQGLIINNKFPYNSSEPFYDNKRLENIINEAIIPKTPTARLDKLISVLYTLQDFEGSPIDIYSKIDHDVFLKKLFFKNHKEYWFYISSLKDFGLVTFMDATTINGNDAHDIKLTYKGLEHIIELQETGEKSKNCFVAMSFSKTLSETRNLIKKTINECGYKPVLIDEMDFESDITINDAIIREIKSCKFLIADFTEQKHGVYFEAGYALGKNKPVIYICSEVDFKNSHFDTNHYPHIVYKDLIELKEKLINKIKAWID